MNPQEDAIGVIRRNWVAAKIPCTLLAYFPGNRAVNWFVWVVNFFHIFYRNMWSFSIFLISRFRSM